MYVRRARILHGDVEEEKRRKEKLRHKSNQPSSGSGSGSTISSTPYNPFRTAVPFWGQLT